MRKRRVWFAHIRGPILNVLSVSYGNDSIALIQWAHEIGLSDVTAAYCDTGWAAPWWPARVDKAEALARSYGFQTVRCVSMGMRQLVRWKKGWPSNQHQFCTTFLKMLPFLEWIDPIDPERKATIIIGKRRAESEDRKDIPEFIESSEYYGDRRIWHPLYLHEDAQRDELIVRAGWEVLPHRSRECNPCVNGNRKTFLGLTPGEVERVSDGEVEVGKPMFRPKRFGALGIHGVIQWAKHGRDRGDIEEEEKQCASMFGCGL